MKKQKYPKEVSVNYLPNVLPQFAMGGQVGDWLTENKEGIVGGLKVAGGIAAMAIPGGQGAGLGLIASGGNDLVTEALDGNSKDNIQQQYSRLPNPNQIPTFGCGGKVKMPMGGTVQIKDVELEQGEVFMDNEGNIGAIKDTPEASHSKGGAPITLEVGTKVLGKNKDKITGKMFKEVGEELARENSKLAKLEEKSKNKLTMNAVKAMRQKLRGRFEEVFARQEAGKSDKMAKGGMVKYALGGPVLGQNVQYQLPEANLPQIDTMQNQDISYGVPGGDYDAYAGNIMRQVNELNLPDNLLTTGMQLAPVAYNLIKGLGKAEKDVLPQEYNQGLSELRDMRFNAQPLYEQNRTNQQIYNYNLKSSGAGAGQYGSGILAGYGSRLRGDQMAGATEQNTNNEYRANYAQGLFGVGRAQSGVDEANLMNEASVRNFGGTALSQLGTYGGIKERQANLQNREGQLYDMYANWYPYISKWAGTKQLWGLA